VPAATERPESNGGGAAYIPDPFELSVPPAEAISLIERRIALGEALLDYRIPPRFPPSVGRTRARLVEFRREVDRWQGENTAVIESILYAVRGQTPAG
jgi:hypothetical protein